MFCHKNYQLKKKTTTKLRQIHGYFFLLSFRLLHQGMMATVTFRMLHTNTVNCSLTWTSYKLVYNTSWNRLLEEEIKIKKNKIKQHLLELNSVKKQLQNEINFYNFWHVRTLFLNINNKKLNRAKSIQNTKLSNLVLENSSLISATLHDPQKVIFNLSSHDLSDDEKSLLCKGVKV